MAKLIRCHLGNLLKHGLRVSEVKECLAGRHLRLRNPSGEEGTYLVVGRTLDGRFLELVYEDRDDCRWVFHAMTARSSTVRLYRRKMRQHGR